MGSSLVRSHQPKLSSSCSVPLTCVGLVTDEARGEFPDDVAGRIRCGAVGKEKERVWEGKARVRAFCKARVLEWNVRPDCV